MRLGKYLSLLTKPELEKIIDESNFTEDEKNVFVMLSKGKSTTEIAYRLSVCERTVDRRIKDIKSKISRLECIEHDNDCNH